MKKLVIISLDLLLALPILSIATALLFSSIIVSQKYVLATAEAQNESLSLFSTSQQIASRLDAGSVNYTAATVIASSLSKRAGLASSIVDSDLSAQCGMQRTVCRLVTVSGSSYLLVVTHENSG